MPVMPKRSKFRKMQKGRMRGKASRGNTVNEGEYGLQALEAGWITSNQIEAARIVLSRYTNRAGQVWIRIFPHLSKTKKPAEVRMGSGKGSPDSWVAVVKEGRIMFEIGGVAKEAAMEALRRAAYKLPIKCKVVVKEGVK